MGTTISRQIKKVLIYCCSVLLLSLLSAITVPTSSQSQVLDSLGQIVLTIAPDQIKGKPLIVPAQAVLLDSIGAQMTTFDLSLRPLSMTADSGVFEPNLLSDPTLFNAGIVDFAPAAVRYLGPTGVTRIRVKIDSVISNGVDVTFNGLDVLEITAENGSLVQTVYSDLLTTIRVIVQNEGSLIPLQQPWIKTYFRSGGGSVKSFLPPLNNSAIDSVLIDLPTDNLPIGTDTLIILSHSSFDIAGTTYVSEDSVLFEVVVLQPAPLQFAQRSLSPDSVYSGELFDFSFNLVAGGFTGPIDSSFVTIRLFSDSTLLPVATLFQGMPQPSSFINDTISYSGLAVTVDTSLGLAGTYLVRLDHYLVSQGNVYAADTRFPDSLFIATKAPISYLPGSLTPSAVFGGSNTSFQFQLQLDSLGPLEVDTLASNVTITGSSFSVTAGIHLSSLNLLNGINSIVTDSFVVPASSIGDSLSLLLFLKYRQVGVTTYTSFSILFDPDKVAVSEQPVVRILDVLAYAPNVPKVNVNQQFRISCTVENMSKLSIDSLLLSMTTDGLSSFSPDIIIPALLPFDTTIVYYDVIAAADSDAAELFVVDVISPVVEVLPPLDHTAIITIQVPANLHLSRIPAPDTVYVEPSTSFDITYTLTNLGTADVFAGQYRFSSGSIDFSIPNPLVDTIVPGIPVVLSLLVPDSSFTVPLLFEFDSLPVDKNSAQTSIISDSQLITVLVVSPLKGGLEVTSSGGASGLLFPGRVTNLTNLSFENTETVGRSLLSVDSLSIQFTDPQGRPIAASSVVDITMLNMIDSRKKIVSRGDVSNDIAVFRFNDITIGGGQSLDLTLQAQVNDPLETSFSVRLPGDSIFARFLAGPQAGGPATAVSQTGDGQPMELNFTPVAGLFADNSFVIRDNPFNPLEGPAEMQFYLRVPSSVQFRIFTLTGEQVYSKFFDLGGLQLDALNIIDWDGRNNDGHIVLNGVYIAQIKMTATGERGRLKIVVLK